MKNENVEKKEEKDEVPLGTVIQGIISLIGIICVIIGYLGMYLSNLI